MIVCQAPKAGSEASVAGKADQPFHIRTPWKSWSPEIVSDFLESRCGKRFLTIPVLNGAGLAKISSISQLDQLGIEEPADQDIILRAISQLTGGLPTKKFTPQKRAHKPKSFRSSHGDRKADSPRRLRTHRGGGARKTVTHQPCRPEWKNPSAHRNGIKNRERVDAWQTPTQLNSKPASIFIKHPRNPSIVARNVGAHRLFETKAHVRTGGNSFTVSEYKPDTGHYAVFIQANRDFPNTQPPIVVNGTVGKIMQTFGV